MYEAEQPDLFEIRLNATGKLYIRKFTVVVRIIILISLLISLLNITSVVLETAIIDEGIYTQNRLLLLRHRVTPFYTAVYLALFVFQIYYYWKVTRFLSRGMEYNNEKEFNLAFHSLYRHAFFGALTLALSVVMNLFDLYLFARFYLN